MYDYNGIVVSGNQLVKEENHWVRVRQSKLSNILYRKESTIYHLILANNELAINNTIFTDFCETNDNDVNRIIDEYVRIYKNQQAPPRNLDYFN